MITKLIISLFSDSLLLLLLFPLFLFIYIVFIERNYKSTLLWYTMVIFLFLLFNLFYKLYYINNTQLSFFEKAFVILSLICTLKNNNNNNNEHDTDFHY